MATATDQAPDTSTFDPDEFMKSRGAAAAPATAFDPDEFMKQRQAAAATPAAPKAAAQPAAPKTASGPQAPEGFGARLWRGLTTPLPRPPGGGEEEQIREGSGPALTGLTTIGAAGVPVQAIAARSLAPFVPLVTGGLGAAAGSLLGRGAGSIAGFSEKGKDVAGDIGGLAGGTLGGLAGEPIRSAITNRDPVARGTQAYRKLIAPTASKSAESLDDLLTIRRAMPYLSEQENLTNVKARQATGPLKGERLGVMNYRQNADMAADKLWNGKIAPMQDSYGAAPVDTTKVANEIRATHNPSGPPNSGKAQAVSDLADYYGKPATIKEALAKVKALNDDKQVVAFENTLPGSERAQMMLADPAIEAKVQAANSLRDAVFDSIEQHGSQADADYVREARKDFGALKQVSKNLGNAPVPTPGSFAEKLLNTAKLILRTRSAAGPIGESFINDPNSLAAKSSRLFGAADLTSRPAPPIRTTPWAPTAPAPFIAPPAPPQAPPNAAGQVTGIGSVVNPQAVGPRGTAGTRFAPKGLLPGPIAGTPAPQVGTPPPVGFALDTASPWQGGGIPRLSFESSPRTPVTQVQAPVAPLRPPSVARETIAPQVPPAEPVTPPKGSTSILPGMAEHVAKQAEGAAKVKGEDLTREANTPRNVDEAAGQLETKGPLFRGKGPQGEIFGGKTEPAAATQSKPLHEEYTPEEIEEAKLLLKSEVGGTEAGERPRVMTHTNEMGVYNPQKIQSAERGIFAGGELQGVGSGRNLYPFLKAHPEYTASMIKQALERPNAPSSQKMLARAAEMVRDEKLTPEEKQAKYQWKPDASRPANAMDLLHALRKPKVE